MFLQRGNYFLSAHTHTLTRAVYWVKTESSILLILSHPHARGILGWMFVRILSKV